MAYICIKSFESEEGDYYIQGNKISDYDYSLLGDIDQEFFEKVHEESRSRSGDELTDTVIDAVGLVAGITSLFNMSSSDRSSSDGDSWFGSDSGGTFDGFGGGDSGGAGAGGDW